MWNNKKKAFTLSYDDGISQDIRFVELLNRYGLKCTFNLNSGIQTGASTWIGQNDTRISRMNMTGLRELYAGHEIAVHTLASRFALSIVSSLVTVSASSLVKSGWVRV